VIKDPELVSEIYGPKNKYTEKDGFIHNYLKELIGDSIVFSPSNDLWKEKRKKLSLAFYKDKMIKMLEIMI
jgi:hypothetical protein